MILMMGPAQWIPPLWFAFISVGLLNALTVRHQRKTNKGNTIGKPKGSAEEVTTTTSPLGHTGLAQKVKVMPVQRTTAKNIETTTASLLQESLPESQVQTPELTGTSLLQEAVNPGMPTDEPTTSLMLNLGNETVNTNLQSALNVLAPEVTKGGGSSHRRKKGGASKGSLESKNSTRGKNGDVILEVIEMDPYSQTTSRFDLRFIAITSLYVLTGLVSVFATYCLAKAIISRRRRQKQYMLLTKSEMEFHRGGGGI